MKILPAIDLRGGCCVRLRQGDYAQETVFGDDPAEMAERWESQGGDILHLVDLDGAKEGRLVNFDAIKAILATVNIPCELGGGIRDEAAISQLLEIGLSRVIIGTRALRDPEWFRKICAKFPGKIVLGIDAKDGKVATSGWLEVSQTDAVELAQRFSDTEIAAIIYTDISTDGMMCGANVAAMAEMKAAVSVDVIASGGVTTLEDVRRLAEAGLDGCIIGRALYEGAISLPEAVRISR
ncbi:MAG: 1-(5-phosphoribosyl)-5-[(5-phosphoribosylamino)methylideneamino]imidazole-4-carboxamide isomerase [Planctomycetia bacterium]|nr:1-(5-phosphoribosyl)-5-[(5-phosphoribosylamino)methylideneamino]imidazole-4-carboxamide isomerase [Planctomycetia bacterium]